MAYGSISVDQINNTTGYSLGAGNATQMKNRIINGAMVIDQRNGGASSSAVTDGYTLDRWAAVSYDGGNVTGKFTVQQNAGSVTPPAGFTNYLGVTSSAATSYGVNGIFTIDQRIEGYNIADLGWGTANAKTVTLSFWVRSSLTGTFGGSLMNGGYSRSYPFSYTISSANTWEQKSITIPGDTTGTWATNNALGIRVYFGLGVGSTYSGTVNTWATAQLHAPTGATSVVGTNGATFYITGVQLEVGSSATGFEYRHITNELQLCQRYYEKSYNIDVAPGTNTGDGRVFTFALYVNTSVLDYGGNTWFKVAKRTNPTITYWTETGTSGTWDDRTSSGSGTLTPITNRVGTSSFSIYCTGSGFSNATHSVSGHWVATAEL